MYNVISTIFLIFQVQVFENLTVKKYELTAVTATKHKLCRGNCVAQKSYWPQLSSHSIIVITCVPDKFLRKNILKKPVIGPKCMEIIVLI